MNKGLAAFFLALVLVLLFGWQAARGYWLRTDLTEKLDSLAAQVTESNHEGIRSQVIDHAKSLGITLSSDDVAIRYEPTADQPFAQSVLAKLATFENYRATITVRSPVRVWGIKLSDKTLEASRIIQVQAISKREPELQQAIQETDAAQAGTPPPAAPPAPPRQSIQDRARSLQQRPELDQELKQ